MSDRLFDPGPPDETSLTDRQKRALYAIRGAGWDGLTSEDIGALIHYPKHELRDTCPFCQSTGHELGAALRQRGLVRQRRKESLLGRLFMVWVDVHAKADRPDRDYDLPAGF